MIKKMVENNSENSTEIFPAYDNKNVAIVFETSEFFVPYLSVALLSLVDTVSEEYNYDILILSCEVKEHDEEELRKIVAGRDNIAIRIVNPHQLVEKYIKKAHYNYLEINYYRIMLPWILKNYDKVINLGADLIIKHDLADLFQTALADDCYMAGALDLGYHGRLSIDISPTELGMKDPYKYVNADVLLFHLKAIRENFNCDALMNVWQKKPLMCAEQDALNMAFDGHVHIVDLKWNVYPDRMASEYHIEHAPQKSYMRWKECLNDPYIIHYAAVPKPWDYPMVGYGYEWWSYARRSAYYEEMLRRMCMKAIRDDGFLPQQVGVKGALINFAKKHCPGFLKPLAMRVKKVLKW